MADRKYVNQGGSGALYFFGIIGAMVCYVQQAEGFGNVIIAILKALVWPSLFVFDLLKHMQ